MWKKNIVKEGWDFVVRDVHMIIGRGNIPENTLTVWCWELMNNQICYLSHERQLFIP